ncbi:MAG: hypothetical protein ACYC59_04525 [Anaerolineaceae bacterium]
MLFNTILKESDEIVQAAFEIEGCLWQGDSRALRESCMAPVQRPPVLSLVKVFMLSPSLKRIR